MLPVETYQDIIEFITTPECCKLICLSSILCDVLTRRIRLAKERRWMCLRKAFMSIACNTDLALLMSLSVELRQLGHLEDAEKIDGQVLFLNKEIGACLQTFDFNKKRSSLNFKSERISSETPCLDSTYAWMKMRASQ
uniref:F-box domain-containing protein n=1 Tax=Ditylenchus dipsaci TaxID=166011 RepID=A0A915CPA2_9BILA